MAQQFFTDHGTAHGLAAPVCLSLKEETYLRHALSIGEYIAKSIHIFHQFTEPWELWVFAARIEVRRAVVVRILSHGEGVWDKVVHALTDPVVGQPLHVTHAEPPAVSTEILAHQSAALLRINSGSGSAKLAQIVMVKGRLDIRKAGVARGYVVGGHELVTDIIDAGHVLTFHCPEVVTNACSEAHIAAVVFNNMANVLYLVGTAPVTELGSEVFAV